MLASLAWRCGDVPAAITFGREAVTVAPAHPGAWEVIVRAGMRTAGAAATLPDAEAWWRACHDTSPVARRFLTEQPEIGIQALRHLAWALVAKGDLPAAVGLSVHPAAPMDVQIHVLLASGQLNAAIGKYCLMRGLDETAQRGWHDEAARWQAMPEMVSGLIWSSLPGDHYRSCALACYDQVVARQANLAEAYWRRAVVLATRREGLPAARNDLYRTLRIEPDRVTAWRKLDEVCRLLGDQAGAQAAYREVERLKAKAAGPGMKMGGG